MIKVSFGQLLLFVCFIACLFLNSCSKDPIKVTEKQLIGTWKKEYEAIDLNNNNLADEEEKVYTDNTTEITTIELKKEGSATMTRYRDGVEIKKENLKWKLLNEGKTIHLTSDGDTEHYEIQTLNKDELTLVFDDEVIKILIGFNKEK